VPRGIVHPVRRLEPDVKALPVTPHLLSFNMANMEEVERLHATCRTGNTADAEALLLKRSKLVNALDKDLGWSPLYRAIMCRQSETAQMLLEYGTNPNLCNRQGRER
jgi:ankyrin repeat protein